MEPSIIETALKLVDERIDFLSEGRIVVDDVPTLDVEEPYVTLGETMSPQPVEIIETWKRALVAHVKYLDQKLTERTDRRLELVALRDGLALELVDAKKKREAPAKVEEPPAKKIAAPTVAAPKK